VEVVVELVAGVGLSREVRTGGRMRRAPAVPLPHSAAEDGEVLLICHGECLLQTDAG
jgi:hypothetical protein